MSFFGYTSDATSSARNSEIGNEVFTVEVDDLDNNTIFFAASRDKYVVTANNVLLTGDIVFKRTAGIGSFNNERILRLPVSEQFNREKTYTGNLFSNFGNTFQYHIDVNGHVNVTGEITSLGEEIYFNITPYIVEQPIRFVDF